MSAVIKCSKCRPGSLELAPDARGNMPYCVGCEDKQAHDLTASLKIKSPRYKEASQVARTASIETNAPQRTNRVLTVSRASGVVSVTVATLGAHGLSRAEATTK